MKLTNYVAQFLSKNGVKKVFVLSGGASLHMIHSVAHTEGIDYVCLAHEQANAMAADGYARMSGKLGVAMATSGPGATNLLTGVCCAYYDSVPTLFLTGQVATFRFRGHTGVRQYGFQETNTVDIFKSVTKYAALLEDPKRIRYELEKAAYIAHSGRPGPVLIDIPDDLQRAEINPEELVGFDPKDYVDAEATLKKNTKVSTITAQLVDECVRHISQASRPVFVAGWGIRLAGAMPEFEEFMKLSQIPVCPTWAMNDSIPEDSVLKASTFGTHGTRTGNFTVQNADLLIAVGSRLDTHETGSPPASFARAAKKIIVDIDANELGKFSYYGMEADLLVQGDAKEFLAELNRRLRATSVKAPSRWIERIQGWKKQFSSVPERVDGQGPVDPYYLVKQLSEVCAEGETIFIDTGCSIAWMMQAFEVKKNQRLIHDFNNTAMGYALPASIGAAFAQPNPKSRIVCVTGDGSLMMNIQELSALSYHDLSIKVILVNNEGHSMIQQTQEQWLKGEHHSSSPSGGLALPNFSEVSRSFGLPTFTVNNNGDIAGALKELFAQPGPGFCNVLVPSRARVIPQVKYGRAIEDSEPLLEREVFFQQMIVETLESSNSL